MRYNTNRGNGKLNKRPFQVSGKVSGKIVLLTYTESGYSYLSNRVSQPKKVQIQKPIQERQFKNLNSDDFI